MTDDYRDVVIEENYREILGEGVPVTVNFLGKIETSFDYTEFPAIIGVIPAGRRIFKAALIIDESFYGNAIITVGDTDGHGRLMNGQENDASQMNIYVAEPNCKFDSNTQIYIYLESGNPTQGTGTIIIYFS